jgi:hypothetical protein
MRFYHLSLLIFAPVFAFAQDSKEAFSYRNDPKNPAQILCEIPAATFATPQGWYPYSSAGKTICTFGPKNEKPGSFSKMISIDIQSSDLKDSKSVAQDWVKRSSGEIDSKVVVLDGIDAYRVSMPPSKLRDLAPSELLFVLRDGKSYMIWGGSKENDQTESLVTSLDNLAKTWKWKR